jgi:DNA-binding transcriptional regulator LsrR (DeoR family)
VTVHEVPVDAAGELFPQVVRRYAFKPMDLITPGDVLGMSWSRTLSGLAASLTQIPPCPIVQLTGAVPPPDGRDLLDLVRSVARVGAALVPAVSARPAGRGTMTSATVSDGC